MRKAGKILVAVTAAVLLSTVVGHAKRSDILRSKLTSHKAVAEMSVPIASDRVALVIANSRYPDADRPLTQIAGDAKALAGALRDRGYQVDVVANARHTDMTRAVARLKTQMRPGGTVILYLGGFGVQSRGQNYLIPTDAAIWTERDVRRQGLDIDRLLGELKNSGAKVQLAYVGASLRNPYERRFRAYSHGLAPFAADASTEIVTAAAADHVVDDVGQPHSAWMTALVDRLNTSEQVEQAFRDVRSMTQAMF
jgi:uncharacterized caspase-like protein